MSYRVKYWAGGEYRYTKPMSYLAACAWKRVWMDDSLRVSNYAEAYVEGI